MAVMHEAELHDLSDDSDYAASIEQGSTSNARNDAGSPSEVNEQGVGEIVYLKDHVTIHPTQYAYERISGRLQLMKIESSLYLSWIPYKRRPNSPVPRSSSAAKMLEKDRNLYTIRSLPLTDVRSVRRYTPALGWQYIIVVLNSGLAYPPLYFYNGGVREFLGTLKQHASLARSQDDANVFLVNNLQDPLQKTLSSLQLPMVSVGAGPSTFHSVNPVPGVDAFDETTTSDSTLTNSANSRRTERPRFKNHDPASDLQFQVLEKFSLITKFARDTTSTLFRDNPLLDGSSGYERAQSFRPFEKPHSLKPPPVDAVADEQDESLVPQTVLVPSDPVEVDKLSLIWGKPRQGPLGPKEWATFLDSEGRIVDSKALKRRIFYGGVESGLRKEIWKLLLGYHEFDSTDAERDYLISLKKKEYAALKGQWQSISANQARKFTKFRERKSLIDKDVVRTDRSVPFYEGDDNPNVTRLRDILLTYSFYNFDLGYCQGMSDLLSPILVIMEDESESFWCFAALMERLGPNFNRDQNGMHSQLLALSKLVELLDGPLHNYLKQADCLNYFFCFRWILIQFKREFDYEEIMRLWEVLWTHYLSEHFHLYMCVAVLKRHRKKIIEEQMDFDTLLKFINELSGKINLEGCLRDAEALCLCAGESGAACIAPGTPPSLPIENDMDSSYAFDDVIG